MFSKCLIIPSLPSGANDVVPVGTSHVAARSSLGSALGRTGTPRAADCYQTVGQVGSIPYSNPEK